MMRNYYYCEHTHSFFREFMAGHTVRQSEWLLLICAVVQVVKNNLNPLWKPFRIPLQSLCGGDVEKSIKVGAHRHTNRTVKHCCSWHSSHFPPSSFFHTVLDMQDCYWKEIFGYHGHDMSWFKSAVPLSLGISFFNIHETAVL